MTLVNRHYPASPARPEAWGWNVHLISENRHKVGTGASSDQKETDSNVDLAFYQLFTNVHF